MRQLSTSKIPLRDSARRVFGIAGIGLDITDRKRAEERILHLASNDSLTGLPNRASFSELLNAAITRSRAGKDDLRSCSPIWTTSGRSTTTLGHEAGDAMLKRTAIRLRETMHPESVPARLEKIEFVVLRQTPPNSSISRSWHRES